MALEPKYIMSLRSDGENIKVTDTTGDYDATTNPGGFGAPNDTKAAVTAATLTLYAPNSEYGVGTTTAVVDIFALGWPVTTEVDIPIASVGWASGKFTDGAIQGVLTVTAPAVETVSYTWTAGFRNVLQCCADSLLAPYRPCDCGANQTRSQIEGMQLDLYAIARAEDGQDIPSMVDAFEHGHEVCSKSSNCTSCGC